MPSQIIFFEKNKIDLEQQSVSITVTDSIASNNGQEFVNFMRNRNNYSAWMTTDSEDAALTQLDIDLGDLRDITDILLIGHNFKDYTIQYKQGLGSYLDFPTPINVSGSTESSSLHNFNQVQATDIKIIISGTQVPDAEKILKQLIITDRIGQLKGWPVVKSPIVSTNKIKSKMLSGKTNIVESLEAFSCTLDVRHWSIQEDVSIVEDIYFRREGVLMWINANAPEQFKLDLRGYRKEDIFLVRPQDEFRPELVRGIYDNGLKIAMKLVEVIR